MINNYNIVAEIVGLVISALLIFLMIFSKPRKTIVYILDMLGVCIVFTSTFTRLYLYTLSASPQTYSPFWFKFVCFILFMQYIVLLDLILAYVSLLSIKSRQNPKTLITIISIFSMIYFFTFTSLLFSGNMYIVTQNNIKFTPYYNLCPIFGILCTLMCIVIILYYRKTLAKIVFQYMIFFTPLEIVMLMSQLKNLHIVFSSITYILPFVIFYLLFHSNPYDEITGCQNRHSYETKFLDNLLLKRKFLIINVVFPKARQNETEFEKSLMAHISNGKSRRIEDIQHGINIYSINPHHYAMIADIRNTSQIENIVMKVKDILEDSTNLPASKSHIHFKLIAFNNNHYIDSVQKLFSLQKYLFAKLGREIKNEHYIAIEKDYEEFNSQYEVETLLANIKNEFDLDDARVICYAQPIYSVNDNSFRTAEALMRLDLDGSILYPDRFIHMAEVNGSIHTLTCIMLNKVCKKIRELDPLYDFDAITINCSTTEFADANLYKELLDIINQNEIPCTKIRLELTESAMSDNYDVVLKNIENLRDAGISFYLDDFGTGYSNLERIITCPFKTIKFDKSLLYKSMDNSGMENLVDSMVDVFKKQGFILLVEGVEDESQNQYSIEKGFNYIQGYKYAKPVPIDELTNYFNKK